MNTVFQVHDKTNIIQIIKYLDMFRTSPCPSSEYVVVRSLTTTKFVIFVVVRERTTTYSDEGHGLVRNMSRYLIICIILVLSCTWNTVFMFLKLTVAYRKRYAIV